MPDPASLAGFPDGWEDAEDGGLLWTLDRVHWPGPMLPLVFSIAGEALVSGLTAAARAYEQPILTVRVRRINTYRYQAVVPLSGSIEEAEGRRRRSEERLWAAMGQLGGLWSLQWLPEVQQHLRHWEDFDLQSASMPSLLAHLDGTLALAARLWEIHFLLATPMYRAIAEFARLYRELFGGQGRLDAYRPLQGFDNKTLQADRALWRLSRRALQLPLVFSALEAHAAVDAIPALAGSIEGAAFLTELSAYLDEYGQRGDALGLDSPSWVEDPTPVIRNLRAHATRPDWDPLAAMAVLAEQRERLVAEARVARGLPATRGRPVRVPPARGSGGDRALGGPRLLDRRPRYVSGASGLPRIRPSLRRRWCAGQSE